MGLLVWYGWLFGVLFVMCVWIVFMCLISVSVFVWLLNVVFVMNVVVCCKWLKMLVWNDE